MFKRSANFNTKQNLKTFEESKLKFEIENFADVTRSLTKSSNLPWESPRVNLSSLDGVWWAKVYTCFQEFDPFSGENLYPFDYKYCKIVVHLKANPSNFDESLEFLAKIVIDETIFLHPTIFRVNSKNGAGKLEREHLINETSGPCSMKLLSLLSSDNPLQIDFTVSVLKERCEVKKLKCSDVNIRKSEIVDNVSKMLHDPRFSDFTFNVKGKEFKVHKNILAASSEYFAKLFVAETKKTKLNRCKISHLDPTHFEFMLRFIYSGQLPDDFNADTALGLFIAARYFNLQTLKMICEQEILNCLNVNNAMKFYKKSRAYNLEELKEKSWTIIKRELLKVDQPLEGEPWTAEEIAAFIEKTQKKSLKPTVMTLVPSSESLIDCNFSTVE